MAVIWRWTRGTGGEESLRRFADEIGLSFHTVRTHRWVAAQRPAEHRRAGVSYEVHRIPASAADRFELTGNPPLSERTGRRLWSAEVAKKLVAGGRPTTSCRRRRFR
ncbi:DUF6192 family protein [Streptomyces acidiscabies]|uniref:DUF6192 family protein n=1 Tax=Streptomyces acidiscabies TaxID=42234 RepID=UPI0038F68132